MMRVETGSRVERREEDEWMLLFGKKKLFSRLLIYCFIFVIAVAPIDALTCSFAPRSCTLPYAIE